MRNQPGISPALLLREPISAIATEDLVALFATVGAAVKTRVLSKMPIFSRMDIVTDYLRSQMELNPIEQFRLLFLDKRNRLIADEIHQTGTVDHVPVYPREVAKRSLEVGATALIIAHNHPSGDASPSQADIAMTKTLVETLKPLGIAVHDHIIVGRDGCKSLRTEGLM